MKIFAFRLPDYIVKKADLYAKRCGISRGEVFRMAMLEYLDISTPEPEPEPEG